MALINCRECGRQISDQAQSCPGCGCPVRIVPQSQVVNREASQKTPNKPVLCPGCRIMVSNQLNNCPKCGHPIATMSDEERAIKLKDAKKRPNNNNKTTLCAIGIFVFLAIIFGIKTDSDKNNEEIKEVADNTVTEANAESLDGEIEHVGEMIEEIKGDVEDQISDANTNDNMIDTEEASEPELDYREQCQILDYESIMRNPDEYKKVDCMITGKIDQVIEGWFDSYTIYITDSAGNKWGCVYTYSDGESRFLEGDNVAVYGVCGGTENTNTVLGKQVTLPRIDVEIIEFK